MVYIHTPNADRRRSSDGARATPATIYTPPSGGLNDLQIGVFSTVAAARSNTADPESLDGVRKVVVVRNVALFEMQNAGLRLRSASERAMKLLERQS
jgi:hypothetical protein